MAEEEEDEEEDEGEDSEVTKLVRIYWFNSNT